MINSGIIKTEFQKLVGFTNPSSSDYAIVDEDNQESTSGVMVGQIGSIASVKVIKDLQDNVDITDEEFNLALKELRENSAVTVCNRILRNKTDLIKSTILYPYEKTFDLLESVISGKFNGFEIKQSNSAIAGKVSWVELSFDKEATFNLYLFNSNKPINPIYTKEVTTVDGESVVIPLDWVIADNPSYRGGIFYLGYFTDDIGEAKPYKKEFGLASQSLNVPYFIFDSVRLDKTTKLELRSKEHVSETHGINLGVEVYTDYTDLFVKNKGMFPEAIKLQIEASVLNLILTSFRNNDTAVVSSRMMDSANIQYYGSKELGVTGVVEKLDKEIENIAKVLFWTPSIRRTTMSI